MILFRPEHVAPIQRDEKTHTRRRGKRRWKVGSVHQARTNMPWQGEDGHFADLRLLSIEPTTLAQTTDEDARLEGYPYREVYIEAYCLINGLGLSEAVLSEPIWDLGFERVEAGEAS